LLPKKKKESSEEGDEGDAEEAEPEPEPEPEEEEEPAEGTDGTDGEGAPATARPKIKELTPEQKELVRDVSEKNLPQCGSCQGASCFLLFEGEGRIVSPRKYALGRSLLQYGRQLAEAERIMGEMEALVRKEMIPQIDDWIDKQKIYTDVVSVCGREQGRLRANPIRLGHGGCPSVNSQKLDI